MRMRPAARIPKPQLVHTVSFSIPTALQSPQCARNNMFYRKTRPATRSRRMSRQSHTMIGDLAILTRPHLAPQQRATPACGATPAGRSPKLTCACGRRAASSHLCGEAHGAHAPARPQAGALRERAHHSNPNVTGGWMLQGHCGRASWSPTNEHRELLHPLRQDHPRVARQLEYLLQPLHERLVTLVARLRNAGGEMALTQLLSCLRTARPHAGAAALPGNKKSNKHNPTPQGPPAPCGEVRGFATLAHVTLEHLLRPLCEKMVAHPHLGVPADVAGADRPGGDAERHTDGQHGVETGRP